MSREFCTYGPDHWWANLHRIQGEEEGRASSLLNVVMGKCSGNSIHCSPMHRGAWKWKGKTTLQKSLHSGRACSTSNPHCRQHILSFHLAHLQPECLISQNCEGEGGSPSLCGGGRNLSTTTPLLIMEICKIKTMKHSLGVTIQLFRCIPMAGEVSDPMSNFNRPH